MIGNVWTHLLQDGDRERSGLAGTRLRLRNNVVTLHDGDDSALLNRRRTLKTFTAVSDRRASEVAANAPVGVDTTEKLRLQVHVVEVVDDLVPVGLNLALGDILESIFAALAVSWRPPSRSGRRTQTYWAVLVTSKQLLGMWGLLVVATSAEDGGC